jgi:F0F1-type ATP synthase assembly protein I
MNKEEESYSKFAKYYKDVGPYLGTGVQLAATVVIMFFIGRWLDGVTGTDPLLTLIFAVLGIAAGLYNFIKTVLTLSKPEDEKRK